MKRRVLPWALVLFGIGGTLALSIGYYVQIRLSVERGHARWVKRVSDLLWADRQAFAHWAEQFPKNGTDEEITSALMRSDHAIKAVLITDLKTHHTKRQADPAFAAHLNMMTPRLAVLELKTQEGPAAQMGFPLRLGKTFYNSASLQLNGSRILTVVGEAPRVWSILDEERRLWGVHCLVYDMDQRPIYASHAGLITSSTAARIGRSVMGGTSSGWVPLAPNQKWRWLASYHYDPISRWIFVLIHPSFWFYLPFLFFVVALAGVTWMVRLTVKESAYLVRRHQAVELQNWAKRVEGFIHGRDPSLKDPPYPFQELSPILGALRWLLPQWQKAEAFPKELALERKLLGILVESLPEAILFFNAQGTLQLSNELGRVFFGMQQEAGREYKMQNGMQIPRGFLETYVEPVFTGKQLNAAHEVEVPWADGKYLYRIWVERIEEVEGQATGYIVVIRDITFRRNFEYVQEQLLSGITHDLRGPLSAVMGYLDLMKRPVQETGNQKMAEYLKLARDAGVRLTQMVSDILDVVRFEQGKIDLQVEAIRVADIFERLRNTFSVTADQKKISLNLLLNGAQEAKTYGDLKLLERIFDNLVGNAIKFTPSGGQITVSAHHDANRMVFSVADTGRGIPREAQSRIFDKFQQVRPGDRSAGYGLGLSVVKFVVQAHKGDIQVESELGAGSKFTFWIPDSAVTNVQR
jgi:signal transduction histidine kinase